MQRWRVVILVTVGVLVVSFVTYKEVRRSAGETVPAEVSELDRQILDARESSEPYVLVFYAEPSDFCCEGTRIYYEDIRKNTEDLVAALDGAYAYVFFDLNTLAEEDRKTCFEMLHRYSIRGMSIAAVVGRDGSKIEEFHAPYDPPAIVAYLAEKQ